MKRKKMLITLSKDEMTWLDTEKARTGESASTIIRQALRQAMSGMSDFEACKHAYLSVLR